MKKLFFICVLSTALFSHTTYLRKMIYTQEPVNSIPKIIHQIWVGDKPIPKKYLKFMETWKEKHPGWIYKLWTNDDIDRFEWRNRDYFDAADNPGMKADIWRYEIIYKYGGVYVDCDMECRRPIDNLISRVEFIAGFDSSSKNVVANSFFASKSGFPLLDIIIKQLSREFPHLTLSMASDDDIQDLTGPRFFSHFAIDFVEAHKNRRWVLLPHEYFQPIECYRNGRAGTEEEKYRVKHICFAVHHNGLSWVDRPFNDDNVEDEEES